jgi:hypothetical protein
MGGLSFFLSFFLSFSFALSSFPFFFGYYWVLPGAACGIIGVGVDGEQDRTVYNLAMIQEGRMRVMISSSTPEWKSNNPVGHSCGGGEQCITVAWPHAVVCKTPEASNGGDVILRVAME